jgi:hypothetical protein
MNHRDAASTSFAYRTNADGSIDSICLDCFLTAGSAQQLPQLKELEKDHHRKKSHLENLLFGGFQFSHPSENIDKSAVAA